MFKNNNSKFFSILTDLGKSITPFLFVVLSLSLGCWSLNEFKLKPQCEKTENKEIWYCSFSPFSPLVGLVSSSIFTSVITILILEIALKEEAFRKMQEILEIGQATKYLKKVHVDAFSQKTVIREALNNLYGGETIRVLCSSDMLKILSEMGLNFLIIKLQKECIFEILTLDPTSALVPVINKNDIISQKQAMIENFSLFDGLAARIRDVNRSPHRENLSGKITVRTYDDLSSSFSYFSIESRDPSKNINLVSIACLMDNELFSYPALVEISEKELIEKANKHFEILWNRSQKNVKYMICKDVELVAKSFKMPQESQVTENNIRSSHPK
jgi:hypothetical protein